MLINDEALPYIRIQRTEFKALDKKALREAYLRSCQTDGMSIQTMMPHDVVKQVVDIGCGMAGVSYFLHCYFNAHLHLVDGTGMGGVQEQYHDHALEPWNDMAVVSKQMTANNVPHTIYPPDPGQTIPCCDLIVSLLSWGFHYPVELYLDMAARSLRPAGVLVLDVRKGQKGPHELDPKSWRLQATLQTGPRQRKKSDRFMLRRNP